MREILFRARRADNGEWVYGTPYQEYSDFWCEWEWKIQTKHPLTNVPYLHLTIDGKTISQFTGLLDKNGKKIFEGDIVTTDIARPYNIVEFRDGCFMFNCNDGDDDYYDIMLPILKEPHTVYEYGEVIGNIYDNPELILKSEF